MPLFTKSRFKLALECPTKIYYNDLLDASDKPVYHNTASEDTFLQILADGGHMVGELAKFYYHSDPINEAITVEERGYDDSVQETERRIAEDLKMGKHRTVIAEAAIRYQNYFIRVDVLVVDHLEKSIRLVEVKSKSVTDDILNAQFKNKNGSYQASFLPYLYDVTFQTLVTEMALPSMFGAQLSEYTLLPILMLVNKDRVCDVEGLHHYFRVIRSNQSQRDVRVEVSEDIERSALGDLELLQEIDMRTIVEELRRAPVPGEYIPEEHSASLERFMQWSCQIQQSNERFFCQPDKRCKSCQFQNNGNESLKSGIHECWANALDRGWLKGKMEDLQHKRPMVTELWGALAGNVSMHGKAMEAGFAFVKDVNPEVIRTNVLKEEDHFSPYDRRVMQIELARLGGDHFRIYKPYLLREITDWEWPLHMIDFETSAPAIPFFKGISPYSTVAFQFSHHIMERNLEGTITIRHAHQFISTDAYVNPSIDFVRSLRSALMPDGMLKGRVFRYSNHENTVLRGLRDVIYGMDDLSDRDELVAFIDLITKYKTNNKTEVKGEKNMIDLLEIVQKGYYSTHAGGSNSLKYILPAILKDAPKVAALYDIPGIYGEGLQIPSLNFRDPSGHRWLQESASFNPYKTLPPMFEDISMDELDELVAGMVNSDGNGTIDQGGIAMAAYNYTQFIELGAKEREAIRTALLKYCELDTLAMCMLTQGLIELSGWR